MAELLIRGGTVIDATGVRRADVAVSGKVIVGVGDDLVAPAGALVLEADGCVVCPGFVDLHTHLREPGREEAETIETGSRAAALGGYTAVVAMPNTEPPIDCASVVREVQEIARRALCEVEVAGAITVGRAGERLAPMAEMAGLGVRLFTDDGSGVQDGRLMRRAFEYAGPLGVTLAQHCEDAALAAGGHMNEGEWSSRLGIPGIPAEAEELMVMRDVALARLTGGRVHFLHLSTAGSVAVVGAARAQGLRVTAEAAPHHLALTEAEVAGYDPVFKVNPPLRTAADVRAVRRGLADGVIDAIATDHAPHAQEAKEAPFDQAPPGMIGLETALAVAITHLTEEEDGVSPMPLADVIGALSWRPAEIAGVGDRHGGPLVAGAAANVCVFDPRARWSVDPGAGASRSRNSPFSGRTLTGRVRHTVLNGEPVAVDGEAQR
ncbi:MAG TPA: dihydroorotase [Acidimicrobiales bacterium]|nr:dihydroorotase [Acidimicrobiales bacterium]